jgi:LmbE family N-acetylglucosaminyl deacetylase
MAERILSVMAHPDDAEFLCAGTLILLHDRGFEIHIASMTPGDCGSRELPADQIAQVRIEEAKAAAAVIDASYHCLDCRDLVVCYDAPTIRRVVELIRAVGPSLVITHSPHDYMADHEFTSLVVRNACFGAPAPNFKTGVSPGAAPTRRLPHLYYAAPIEGMDIFGEPVPASVIINISDAIGLKSSMLACHASQREWLRGQHGIDEYIETMRRWSECTGRRIGVTYGEAFRQHVGHAYPKDDLLAELLGGRRC